MPLREKIIYLTFLLQYSWQKTSLLRVANIGCLPLELIILQLRQPHLHPFFVLSVSEL
jgi:hypothetical protein